MLVHGSDNRYVAGEFVDILRKLRMVDDRFPEAVSAGAGRMQVEELGHDFQGLLNRMRKEGFIVQVRSDDDATSAQSKIFFYTFGERFFLEFGVEKLVQSYFYILNDNVPSFELSPHLEVEMRDAFKDLETECRSI